MQGAGQCPSNEKGEPAAAPRLRPAVDSGWGGPSPLERALIEARTRTRKPHGQSHAPVSADTSADRGLTPLVPSRRPKPDLPCKALAVVRGPWGVVSLGRQEDTGARHVEGKWSVGQLDTGKPRSGLAFFRIPATGHALSKGGESAQGRLSSARSRSPNAFARVAGQVNQLASAGRLCVRTAQRPPLVQQLGPPAVLWRRFGRSPRSPAVQSGAGRPIRGRPQGVFEERDSFKVPLVWAEGLN